MERLHINYLRDLTFGRLRAGESERRIARDLRISRVTVHRYHELAERPLDRLRAVQAILRLEETVGPQRLEAACARAMYYGDVRYRRIKQILNAALDQEPLPEAAPRLAQRSFAFARSGAEFFTSVEGSAR